MSELEDASAGIDTWARSGPGTATAEVKPWDFRLKKRAAPIRFPFPTAVDSVEEAWAWANLASIVAAELRARSQYSLLLVGSLFGAATGAAIGVPTALGTSGSEKVGDGTLPFYFRYAVAILVAAIFVTIVLFLAHWVSRRTTREAFALVPTWERRALAYERRAAVLDAALQQERRDRALSSLEALRHVGESAAPRSPSWRWEFKFLRTRE